MSRKAKLLIIGITFAITIASMLLLLATGKPIRVACVGDSITEGFDYPNNLQLLLGAKYEVGNFGVGGSTVSLDSLKPYMKMIEFQEAKQFQPNIVVVMLGTNDARPSPELNNATFISDYLKLLGEFQGLKSKPRIWIVKPPPVLNSGLGLSTQNFESNIIPSIETTAKEADVPIIDVYSALGRYPMDFPDGVHPNSEASKRIAQEIFTAISKNEQPNP